MEEEDIARNTDPRFEMYSKESQNGAFYQAVGFALIVVFFLIMPWAIGCGMLIKWIIF